MNVGMTQNTVSVEVAVFKAHGLKVDSEGTPILNLSFEVRGRGMIDRLNMGDIASLIGKPVTLNVIDHQMRITEE